MLEAQQALAVDIPDPNPESEDANTKTHRRGSITRGKKHLLDEEAIPDDEILVSACAGLVAVDRQSGIIRLVHYTAQEYFEEAFRDRMGGFRVELARICLAYLGLEGVKGLGGGNDADKEEREGREKLAFWGYAAQYWGEHARGGPEEALGERIVEFCLDSGRLGAWYRTEHWRVHGFDVDDTVLEKLTGLHVAAKFGLAMTVREMLRSGRLDVNVRDVQGMMPLHYAASGGHGEVVKVLLGEDGVEVDAETLTGETPLSLAAEGGHTEVVKLLVERAAERGDVALDAHDSVTSVTPLWRAANQGHDGVVRVLLSSPKVNVNAEDGHFGETPLARAVKRGHLPVVREILALQDVDVSRGDSSFGDGALAIARKLGRDDIRGMIEEHIRERGLCETQ